MSMVLTPFGWQLVHVNGSQIMPKTSAKRSVVPWYPNVNFQRQTEPTSVTKPPASPNVGGISAVVPENIVASESTNQGRPADTNAFPTQPLTTEIAGIATSTDAAIPNEKPKRIKNRRIGSIRCSKCNKFGLRTECCADALYFVVVRSKFIPKQIQSGIGRRSFHSFKEADVFRECVAERVKQRRLNQRQMEEQSMKRKRPDSENHHSYPRPEQQQQQQQQFTPQDKRKRPAKARVLRHIVSYLLRLQLSICSHSPKNALLLTVQNADHSKHSNNSLPFLSDTTNKQHEDEQRAPGGNRLHTGSLSEHIRGSIVP